MMKNKKEKISCEKISDLELHYSAFGKRIREIRKERNLTQDQLAKILGTSKQILSRYELYQRSPKIEQVIKYAEKLNVSVDYLLSDTTYEAVSNDLCSKYVGKPFYKVFVEVTNELKLTLKDVVRITGLTEAQISTVIFRRIKDAPLPIALQLSQTLNVPIEVWAGEKVFTKRISAEAYEVARSYDYASIKEKKIVKIALNIKEKSE